MSELIFFTSLHFYFVEKLNFVEKNLLKLNYSHGKVSHILKFHRSNKLIFLFLISNKRQYEKKSKTRIFLNETKDVTSIRINFHSFYSTAEFYCSFI